MRGFGCSEAMPEAVVTWVDGCVNEDLLPLRSVCLVIRTVLGCRLCSIVCLTPSTELGKATRT